MVQSMTAFARLTTQDVWGSAVWEIRIVNHRYFDCIIKLPEAFCVLEANIRAKLRQQLHRGRVDCYLKFLPNAQENSRLDINAEQLTNLNVVISKIKDYLPLAPVDPMKILSWPQVLKAAEIDFSFMHDILMALFEKTLADTVIVRQREGEALAQLLKEKLHLMLNIVLQVKQYIPQILKEQRAKVVQRLEEVISNLDQERLEQEMVYFAQKIDVTEEVERLEIHIHEVLRILDNNANEGKKLDFLMQELNREANTLGAKAVDVKVTRAAIELKVLIEQMREQVQNIV